ncbi:MAG: SoxR reducing system RseC family protein [Clostridia bacterium]|nr:SoxR reducing system RseC family protein [Clostridia bacterium]
MERIGQVTAVNGDELEITFCRPSDCEKCNACHGGKSQTTLILKGKANVGDGAVVKMPVKSFMQASATAYVFPLVALLGGMFIGAAIFPAEQDIAGLIGAAVGLGVSMIALKLTEKRRSKDPRWQPQLVEIIPQPEGANNHGN